jgi:phosphomethylpyrimidine synthase
MASCIAAQAGETALGHTQAIDRENAIAFARKNLDWKGMQKATLDPEMIFSKRADHAQEEVCTMCGEFYAVKMLR